MIEINDEKFQEISKQFESIPKAIPKVVSRAINKTLVTTRKTMIQEVKEEYDIKTADVRETLAVKNANPSGLEGIVFSRGAVISLAKFKITGGVKRVLKAQVKKEGKKPISYAFKATMSSGHTGAFKRVTGSGEPKARVKGAGMTKGREEIEELYGPSIPQMLGGKKVVEDIRDVMEKVLEKNLDHETRYILEGGK